MTAGTVPFPSQGSRVSSVSNRSTVELVVLALTGTVCVLLLLGGAGVIVAVLLNPGDPNLEPYVGAFGSAVTVIVGALLGLIAGRRVKRGEDSER